ncbi:MAG: hypothetical protein WCP08_11445 [Prolixibacteraceae bacterium]
MKKFILLLMALFVVSSIGFASNDVKIDKTQAGIQQLKNISIDLGDITYLTEGELSQLITESVHASLSPLPVMQCSVTVTVSAKVGVFNVEASATASGDCSEVRAIAKALANQVLADIRAFLMEYF